MVSQFKFREFFINKIIFVGYLNNGFFFRVGELNSKEICIILVNLVKFRGENIIWGD